MTSHPPGPCCVTGLLLTGETHGTIKVIGDTPTYITLPPRNTNNSKAIIFLTEACGIFISNDQLLADSIAAAGYTVVMPDLFHGDPHPLNDNSVDLYAWLAKHPVERVDPVVQATLKMMREEMGFSWIGAVGYCFGAKYAVRWLRQGDGKIDAGFVAHPSFVEAEELKSIKGPLSIAAAESDYIFTVEKRHESEATLRELDVPWQISLYSDVKHSFAVRGDPAVRRETWAKEQALQQALRWFEEHSNET